MSMRPDSYVDTHPKSARILAPKGTVKPSPVAALREELRQSDNAREMLQAELGFTQKELEEDIRKIAALEREAKKLSTALTAAHEQQEETEREKDELRSQAAQLQREKTALTLERNDLDAKRIQLEKQVSDLEKTVAQQRARLDNVEQELADVKEHAMMQSAAMIKDAEATIKKQEVDLMMLRTERDTLKNRTADQEKVMQLHVPFYDYL